MEKFLDAIRTTYIPENDLIEIAKKTNIDLNDDRPLILSIMRCCNKLFDYLIKKGYNYHKFSEKAFRIACDYENEYCCERLLSLGVDISAVSNEALKSLSIKGNIKLIKLLLKYGADINFDDGVLSVIGKDKETIQFFIDNNINLSIYGGQLILEYSYFSELSDSDDDILKTIIKKTNGLFYYEKVNALKCFLSLDKYDLFKLTINDIYFNNNNIDIFYILCDAIYKNKKRFVKLCLDHGANPNLESGRLLEGLIFGGNYEIMELLLKNNADPNINDGSLLLKAVNFNSKNMVNLLLKYGADPNLREGEIIANAKENHDIAKYFKFKINKFELKKHNQDGRTKCYNCDGVLKFPIPGINSLNYCPVCEV